MASSNPRYYPLKAPNPGPASLVRPWQFGLRTLLILMASLSLLFLVMGIVGLVGSVLLVWMLVLVVGHVVGNTLGARQGGQRAIDPGESLPANSPLLSWPKPLAADPASIRLRHQTAFGAIDFVFIAAAGVLAGGLGAAALWAIYWNQFGYSAIVVGGVSSAVIGIFLGFLCVSFVRVALAAMNDARQQSQSDRYQPCRNGSRSDQSKPTG